MAIFEEGETQGPDSYNRFKTQHEVSPDEIEKVAPRCDKLDELDQVNPFGTVVQYITEGNGIILVMPRDPQQIYDLDNIVCFPQDDTAYPKIILGFISDVVGPVSMPLYSVILYKELQEHCQEDLKTYLKGK